MLDELKFVMGAVAKRDLVPGMTHFCIENRTIRSFNGSLALCSPINFDIDCKPHAQQLIKAIGNCSDEHVVTISITPSGRIRIQNGAYEVYVDCIGEETPHVRPEGETVPINGEELRKAFEALQPFIGTDASRPWTNGVLLHDKSAYATNNVIICQFWLGTPIPLTLNVPGDSVKEVLRIKEYATHVQVTENSITFHFPNGRWIRSRLWENRHEQITQVMESVVGNPVVTNPKFFDGLKAIEGFANKQNEVFFHEGKLCTHVDDGIGGKYALEDFPHRGCYNIDQLKLLEGTAKSIDFSTYPRPCLFYGDMIRGAIIGRRMAGDSAK